MGERDKGMDVYFGRSFWYDGRRRGESRPGVCLKSGAEFCYGGFGWQVPAVYVCQEGIVVDICRRVPGEAVQTFWDVWGVWQGREEEMSPEQQRMAERANPFSFEADFRVEMDGREWFGAGGSGMCIQPRGLDGKARVGDGTSQKVSGGAVSDQEVYAGKATVGDGAAEDMRRKTAEDRPEDVLAAEYGLDGRDGWQVFRRSFRAKDPEAAAAMKNAAAGAALTFRLTVEAGEEEIPCEYTFVTEVGCGERTERFFHPVTGQKMELVILGCRPYNMEAEIKNMKKCPEGYRIPSHGCVMEYVLKPGLPSGESLSVRDCCQGEELVYTKEAKGVGKRAAAVALIGGCDGPVSVFIAGTTKGQHEEERSLGYSSLYVEPVKEVRWKVELRGGLFDPETFELRAEGEDYGAKGQD